MSVETSRFRRLTAVQTDGWGFLLAGLFVVVLVGAVWMATWFASAGVEPAMSGSSGSEQAAAGAGWALAEVGVAVLLLGFVLLWKRLPEWVQDVVKTGVLVVGAMVLGDMASQLGMSAFWTVAVGVVGYYAIIKAADAFDVYWLWNNFESIALAIVLGAGIGAVLPLPFLLVGIVGLTIYDHVFANEKDWMFTLGEGMLRAKLPVIVFAFPKLRVSWDAICDEMGGDDDALDDSLTEMLEEGRGFGIGMADLLLPAAFAAAVTLAGGGVTLPVVGVVAGIVVAAFRLRWEMVNIGSGAGLPAITGGIVGGYAIASLVVIAL